MFVLRLVATKRILCRSINPENSNAWSNFLTKHHCSHHIPNQYNGIIGSNLVLIVPRPLSTFSKGSGHETSSNPVQTTISSVHLFIYLP